MGKGGKERVLDLVLAGDPGKVVGATWMIARSNRVAAGNGEDNHGGGDSGRRTSIPSTSMVLLALLS
jgi:hypothetical protein